MWKRSTSRAPVPVVLYTRPQCHLCEEMKAELARARTRVDFELEEVDVDSDQALADQHGLSIPVLMIAGRPAFKGRLTAEDFVRKLERRASEDREAGENPLGEKAS